MTLSSIKDSFATERMAAVFREIELDASHRTGTTFECYFDTAQVQEMVLGMYDLEIDGQSEGNDVLFNLRPLDEATSVVPLLASAGFLGPIHMLPTHQAEFEHRRRLRFGIPFDDAHRPVRMADALIRQAQKNSSKSFRIQTKENLLRGDVVYTMIDSLAPLRQFQLVESLQGNPLAVDQLRASGILVYRQYSEQELISLLSHELFHPLLEQFNATRPAFSHNNVADALAFVSLCEKVQAYVRQETDVVPRYFLSGSRRAVQRITSILEKTGAMKLLTYKNHDREREKWDWDYRSGEVTAIRTWEYFLYHAVVGTSFVPRHRELPAAGPSTPPLEQAMPPREDRASAFRHTFERLSRHPRPEQWVKIKPRDKSGIDQRVHDVIDAGFLDSVLLGYVKGAMQRVSAVLKENEKAMTQLEHLIEAKTDKIQAFTWDTLVRTTDIYWAFLSLQEHLGNRFRRTWPQAEREFWYGLRLFHLALPPAVEKAVITWLTLAFSLERTGGVKARTHAWQEIMQAYFSAKASPNSAELDVTQITAVTAILMAGRDRAYYPLALDLLDSLKRYSGIWLSLMRIHCKIEMLKFYGLGDDLRGLVEQYGEDPDPQSALGIAIAHSKAGRLKKGVAKRDSEIQIPHCRHTALHYAYLALKHKDATIEQQASACNLILHIRLFLSPWHEGRVVEAAERLVEFGNSPAWQPIFNATMLQYYCARADKSPEVACRYLQAGVRYDRRLMSGPVGDDLQEDHIRFQDKLAACTGRRPRKQI